MKRMRKIDYMDGGIHVLLRAVFAQKAERKNVREGNKFYETEKVYRGGNRLPEKFGSEPAFVRRNL